MRKCGRPAVKFWSPVQIFSRIGDQESAISDPDWCFILACVAGGMRERASGGAAIFAREEFASGEAVSEIQNSTRLYTNPPMASPLPFTSSQPKQKHSRAKSHQLRRLVSSGNMSA